MASMMARMTDLIGYSSVGLCQCGCGKATTIALATQRTQGRVRGQPIAYIHGHNRRRPVLERFWDQVEPEPNSGCLLWIGSLIADSGYGSFTFSAGPDDKPRTMGAHRFAWEMVHGPIRREQFDPRRWFVCHRCDVRPCVNERHLFLGTAKANSADMMKKGRNGRGKITAAVAAEIRRWYRRGGITQAELARGYGLHHVTIHMIVTGQTWRLARGPRTTRRMQTSLTEDQVRAIRLRYSLGVLGLGRLAKMYDVSKNAIWQIVKGRVWRHVY